jgi:hypothetical protein
MATIGQRIIETLGGVTSDRLQEVQAQATEQASRAYEAGYNDANDEPPTSDLKTYSYRRMGGGLRDFSAVDRDTANATIWTLWQSSLIAVRLMELKRDHLVGVGATPQTKDKKLQAVLDKGWRLNNMQRRLGEFCLQLFLLGEQCITAFVRKADGRVEHGYIDPDEIERVISHPENSLKQYAVICKPLAPTIDTWVKAGDKRRVYRIVQEDAEVVEGGKVVYEPKYPGKLITASQAYIETWEKSMLTSFELQAYTGDCFYEGVNRLSNQSRGTSDLQQAADWIDQGESTLHALGEREQFASFFSWFVNLGDTEVNSTQWNNAVAYVRKNKPKKGSVNLHNNSMMWDMTTPDIKQQGSVATFVAILTFIMGGMGFPLSWYGYGNDTNRATLDKQADPTEKSLEYDQTVYKDFILTILRFWRDQAAIAKNIGGASGDAEIDLSLPEINQQNIAESVAPFVQLIQGMIAARDGDMLTRETAVKGLARFLQELGVEINPTEELAAIDEAKEAKDEADTQGDQDELMKRMATSANGKAKETA